MEIYNYIDPIIVLVIAFVAVIYSVVVTLAFLGVKIKYNLLKHKTGQMR